jgi:hypothetical protein
MLAVEQQPAIVPPPRGQLPQALYHRVLTTRDARLARQPEAILVAWARVPVWYSDQR